MKKLTVSLLAVLLLIVSAVFVGCGEQPPADEEYELALSQTSITLTVGEEKDLSSYLSVLNGDEEQVTDFEVEIGSNATSIVEVVLDTLKIKAIKKGSAKITFFVTVGEQLLTVKLTVTVNEVQIPTVTVTVNGEEGTYEVGEKLTAPEAPEDYEEGNFKYTFSAWVIEGTEQAWNFDADEVTEAVTIVPFFTKERIKATVIVNGTQRTYTLGDYVSKPRQTPEDYEEEGIIYTFSTWVIEGTDTEWNFQTMKVTDDVTIVAKFVKAPMVTVIVDGVSSSLRENSYIPVPTAPAAPNVEDGYVALSQGWFIKDTDTEWNFKKDKATEDVELIHRYKIVMDCGTLEIADLTVYAENPKYIPTYFSGERQALNYEYDDTLIDISSEGVITVKGGTGKVEVAVMPQGASEPTSLDTTFTVTVKGKYQTTSSYFTEAEFRRRIGQVKTKVAPTGEPAEHCAIWVGDSFFDPWFFNNLDRHNFFEDHFNGYYVATAGISSANVIDTHEVLGSMVFPYSPDAVMIHIGTNDMFNNGATYNATRDRVLGLINDIHAVDPDIHVYWFSIEYRSYSTDAQNRNIDRANALIKEYLDSVEWATYLDSNTLTSVEGANGRVLNTAMFLDDGIHPASATYQVYVDLLTENGLDLSADTFNARMNGHTVTFYQGEQILGTAKAPKPNGCILRSDVPAVQSYEEGGVIYEFSHWVIKGTQTIWSPGELVSGDISIEAVFQPASATT